MGHVAVSHSEGSTTISTSTIPATGKEYTVVLQVPPQAGTCAPFLGQITAYPGWLAITASVQGSSHLQDRGPIIWLAARCSGLGLCQRED